MSTNNTDKLNLGPTTETKTIAKNDTDKLNLGPTKTLISSILLIITFGPSILDFLTAIDASDQDKKWHMAINGWIIFLIGIPLLFIIIGIGVTISEWWAKKTDLQKSTWLKIIGIAILLLCFALGLSLVKNLPALLRALW